MGVNLSFDTVIEKAFSNFKKITPLLVVIALVSGGVLFLPETILTKMSLNALPNVWKQVIGILFLVSMALSIVIVIFEGFGRLNKMYRKRKIYKNYKISYLALNLAQKNVIKQMVKNQEQQIELDSTSGITQYLLNCHFILQPQQTVTFQSMDAYSHSIMLVYTPHPWLINLYIKEPDLFE